MRRSMVNKAPQTSPPPHSPKPEHDSQILKPPCDVFINHRGIETRTNIAGLLHDHLMRDGLRSFLDCETLMPGEILSDEIKLSIHQCKVGIAIFSPQYCNSGYCLSELTLLTETGKRLVPIFWNVEPSQLTVPAHFPAKYSERFWSAIYKARDTVGIPFNSSTGDWSKLLRDTCEAVKRILSEQDGPGHTTIHPGCVNPGLQEFDLISLEDTHSVEFSILTQFSPRT